MVNWTNTSSSNTTARYLQWRRDIIYDATDNDIAWFEPWGGSYPQGRMGRNDLTTKAAVWMKEWSTHYGRGNATPTLYQGLAKIGTNLYTAVPYNAASGFGGEFWDRQIYRIAWADGTLSATIPLPTGYTVAGGLTTDGTDLLIWTNRGIVRMTTAGVITANYGYPYYYAGAVGEYNLAPWDPYNGNSGYQQLFKGQDHGHMFRYVNQTLQYPTFTTQGGLSGGTANENARHLRFVNGKLWLPFSPAENAGAGMGNNRPIMPGITGANCFSRALLDAPVTKTSSQTMKVSYELTLPDMDTWVHTFPSI